MKRILALTGVILLVLLYLLTLVFSLMKSPEAINWFKASLVATIAVPCLIYAYQLIYRVLKSRSADPAAEEMPDQKRTVDKQEEIDGR
ncbi:MAG: hypothetical protein QM697_16940 [Lachnospiraceae bacterium]